MLSRLRVLVLSSRVSDYLFSLIALIACVVYLHNTCEEYVPMSLYEKEMLLECIETIRVNCLWGD